MPLCYSLNAQNIQTKKETETDRDKQDKQSRSDTNRNNDAQCDQMCAFFLKTFVTFVTFVTFANLGPEIASKCSKVKDPEL